MKPPRNIEITPRTETQRRNREIQILLNLIEPDPEYQPFLLTDEACIFDVSGADADTITSRLEFYFRRAIPVPLTTPLWQLVDALKASFPGWPDDWIPGEN
jgi:hypothetical protein